jgi:hypothetical protein
MVTRQIDYDLDEESEISGNANREMWRGKIPRYVSEYLNVKETNSTFHSKEVEGIRHVILYIHNGISIARANKLDRIWWHPYLLRHTDIFLGELDFWCPYSLTIIGLLFLLC